MHKLNSKLLMAATLSALLVAGCGGGGGGFINPPVVTPPSTGGGTGGGSMVGDISQSVAALYAYINDLISGTSDMTDPVNINSLTLATDDAADATPLN